MFSHINNSTIMATMQTQKEANTFSYMWKKIQTLNWHNLWIYREEGAIQKLAKVVFDFSIEEKKKFELLFDSESNIMAIHLSECYGSRYHDDEPRYKLYNDDFARINDVQVNTEHFERRESPKIYRLFKLSYMKDKIFYAFTNRPKLDAIVPEQKPEAETKTTEDVMEIVM